jgi:sarcosine oxidase subunit gamma
VPEPLTIEDRAVCGAASVMARNGVTARAVADALGTPLIDGPCWASDGEIALLGSGPGTWLAIGGAPGDLAQRLRARLGTLASVSDQSGAYLILRLAGCAARTVLQRGAPIDLHPDAFGPGSVATTVIAHIGVVIRQLDAAPTYEVAVFRSYAGSFRHWLDRTAAAL